MANPRSPRLEQIAGLAALALAACTFPALRYLVGPEAAAESAPGPRLALPRVTASPGRRVGPPPEPVPEATPTSLLASVAPSVTLASSAAKVQSSTRAAPRTPTFLGRVVGPSGEPIPGVRLSFESYPPTVAGEGLTGPDGTFRVAVGLTHELRWQLTLEPPLETGLVARSQGCERRLQLGTHDLGDLALEQGWSLSGVVIGPEGEPQAGVEVRLQDESSHVDQALRSSSRPLRLLSTENPETGASEFCFEVLEPNGFLARTVSGPDGSFSLPAVEGKPQVLVAERGSWRARLNLWPRADLRGLRLVLDGGFALEVLVRDERGDPISGARVQVRGAEEDSFEALSDAEGRALLPAVAGISCQLTASAPGRRSVALSPQRNPGPGRTQVTLTFGAASVVRGRCTEAGVVWARPRAGGSYVLDERGDSRGEIGEIHRHALGSFVFPRLKPGVYDLLLKRPDEGWAVLAEQVLVEARGARDLGDLTPVSLTPIRLRVLSPTDEPVAGAILRGPAELPEAKTDSEGRCELIRCPSARNRKSGSARSRAPVWSRSRSRAGAAIESGSGGTTWA